MTEVLSKINQVITKYLGRLKALAGRKRAKRRGAEPKKESRLIRSIKVSYQVSTIVLALLASIFTIIAGILTLPNIDSFNEWINREFQTEQYWLKAANSLAPEVNVSVFDKKLGQPVFVSTLEGLTNRTYVNEYFYTQAISSDDGTVLLYSITLRKANFYPNIPYFENDRRQTKLLGKTTFGELAGDYPQTTIAGQYLPGFRRGIYSEGYYFGNPGNYLYYFLTTNDAGIGGAEYIKLESSSTKAYTFEETGLFDDCSRDFLPMPGSMDKKENAARKEMEKAQKLMKNVYANTITVTNPNGGVICANEKFFKEHRLMILGPDLDKVRLLRD